MRVAQLMTRDVVTVAPETTLKEAAKVLTQHRISGLPVCDREGRVVGVFSEADILRSEDAPPELSGLVRRLLEVPGGKSGSTVCLVGQAMTSPAITITPTASAAEAARTMIRVGVNRLPVVQAGRLVGIVTRADLVRAFHRSDEEIAQEIADDVLLHTLWISPDEVRIAVTDGIVELEGELENHSAADLVVAYTRRIPGVIDVEADLTWRVDDLARRVSNRRLPSRL